MAEGEVMGEVMGELLAGLGGNSGPSHSIQKFLNETDLITFLDRSQLSFLLSLGRRYPSLVANFVCSRSRNDRRSLTCSHWSG